MSTPVTFAVPSRFRAALTAQLGLPRAAGDGMIAATLDELIARARATDAPQGFVPRAVHDAAAHDLAEAEAELAARQADTQAGMAYAVALGAKLLPHDLRLRGHGIDDQGLAVALNHREPSAAHRSDAGEAQASATGIALNAEAGQGAPEWAQLLPAGPLVAGRDGRRFTIADPAAIVAATTPHLPLVIDFEHATELGDKGRDGGAPAAGWIEDLSVRAGQIWGRVVWTERAGRAVAAREYRFLSPVFGHARDAGQTIHALISAGLVHRPNLDLKALNAREGTTVLAALLKILDLSATAGDAEVLDAVRALKDGEGRAANAAEPDLARYVPAHVHDAAVRALNAATAQLAERDGASARDRARALLDGAVSSGRVTPAMRGHYEALALNHYDTVAAMVGAMPVIVPGGESERARQAAADVGRTGPGLSEQQRSVCAMLGLDEAGFAKSLAKEAERAPPRPRA